MRIVFKRAAARKKATIPPAAWQEFIETSIK